MITLTLFFALFGIATAAMGYIVGRYQGYIRGKIAGLQEARTYWLPRLIRTAFCATRTARHAAAVRKATNLRN